MIQALQTETTYIHPRDLIKVKLWTYEEAASARHKFLKINGVQP